jgi:F0F1-type ATP synthase membrane subunit b/b'
MKLLEEIKEAEEKAENMKKNAEIEGQKLIERTRAQGEKDMSALDHSKDALLEQELNKTRKAIDKEIKNLAHQHEQTIKKIMELYDKNKNREREKRPKKAQVGQLTLYHIAPASLLSAFCEPALNSNF